MNRTLIVGDVHGCSAELSALLRQTHLDEQDQLVLVGDMVAKGPDSAGVLRIAQSRQALAVLGNHELRLLAARKRLLSGETEPNAKLIDLCRSLEESDWAYLERLPAFLRLPGEVTFEGRTLPGILVVHAGFDPRTPLESQPIDQLANMRSIRSDGQPTKKLDGDPWAGHWTGPELVVFGHDAVRGFQSHPYAVGLDTGCVYGGRLSGLLIEDGSLMHVSVPAAKVYQPIR